MAKGGNNSHRKKQSLQPAGAGMKNVDRRPTMTIDLADCTNLLGEAPNCRQLLRSWLGWRGEEFVPFEHHVVAEELGDAFGSVSILEAVSCERVVFRLCASLHTHITGLELKGINVLDLTPKKVRQIRMQQIWNTASYPCGCFFVIAFTRQSGFQTLVQGLAMPVRAKVATGPMRLYVAVDDVTKTVRPPLKPVDKIPPAHETIFIDIGFGTPDYYE
jgi:hypothetical protein